MTPQESRFAQLVQLGDIALEAGGHFVRLRTCGEAHPPRPIGKLTAKGYVRLCVEVRGERIRCKAHRLVWILAHGDIPDNLTVDHINRNKADNRLENLRLLTKVDNTLAAGMRGSGHGNSKLTEAQVLDIRSRVGQAISAIAREFGVDRRTVFGIVRGTGWKHLLNQGSSKPVPEAVEIPK